MTPSGSAATLSAQEQQTLREIEQELAGAGQSGTHVGSLLEKRGDLLDKAARTEEAIASYEAAARAYSQSPEATTMPVARANAVKQKAEKLKAQRGR